MKISNSPHVAREADLEKAAQGLEAMFLRQMLKELHGGNALMGKGVGAETFGQMLNEALAEQLAKAGGLGVGRALVGGSVQPSPSQAFKPRSLPAASEPNEGAKITSQFGLRHDPIGGELKAHHGVDLAGPIGQEVVSALPGRVVRAGPAGSYGNLVVVDHGQGLETRYAHLGSIDVTAGEDLPQGAPVGKVGLTGRTTGPHLHFEVRREGKPIDPATAIGGIKVLR